ncbi:MAG TPA: GNAT family N-acetyltransferase [Anaerolineae bacterium]
MMAVVLAEGKGDVFLQVHPHFRTPAHQRRGLGKAVMAEGLRRAKRLGATMAYVGSYSPAAHALYASVGFTEYDLYEPWLKVRIPAGVARAGN